MPTCSRHVSGACLRVKKLGRGESGCNIGSGVALSVPPTRGRMDIYLDDDY
jgi:hypothetical protein